MITKRQLIEELDKCIKQDGYAIYIKADSAVMIKEWMEHAPGCDNCTHKDDRFSVCGGCEDGSEYETETTEANCGECHRRYYCEESPDSCFYSKAQAEPEQNPERFNVQRTIWFDSNPTIKTWKEETERDNTLDEAIAHAEAEAKANEAMCESCSTAEAKEHIRKCAEEHRQLASWLQELKERRAKE
jgi:hypothetical protein